MKVVEVVEGNEGCGGYEKARDGVWRLCKVRGCGRCEGRVKVVEGWKGIEDVRVA